MIRTVTMSYLAHVRGDVQLLPVGFREYTHTHTKSGMPLHEWRELKFRSHSEWLPSKGSVVRGDCDMQGLDPGSLCSMERDGVTSTRPTRIGHRRTKTLHRAIHPLPHLPMQEERTETNGCIRKLS